VNGEKGIGNKKSIGSKWWLSSVGEPFQVGVTIPIKWAISITHYWASLTKIKNEFLFHKNIE